MKLASFLTGVVVGVVLYRAVMVAFPPAPVVRMLEPTLEAVRAHYDSLDSVMWVP
jgi:hypothetical protein